MLLLPLTGCLAQYRPGRQLTSEEVTQAADSSRLQVHGSLFGGVFAGYGLSGSYIGAAPTLTFHAKPNLWLGGTVFFVGGQAGDTRSLAPYRNGRPPQPVEFHPGGYSLDAFGGTVSLCYKTKRNNYFDIHLTYFRDNGGTLAPLLFNPFYTSSAFGIHGSIGPWY